MSGREFVCLGIGVIWMRMRGQKGEVGEEVGKRKLLSAKKGAVKSDNKSPSGNRPYAVAASKTLRASLAFQECPPKNLIITSLIEPAQPSSGKKSASRER